MGRLFGTSIGTVGFVGGGRVTLLRVDGRDHGVTLLFGYQTTYCSCVCTRFIYSGANGDYFSGPQQAMGGRVVGHFASTPYNLGVGKGIFLGLVLPSVVTRLL